MTKIDNKLDRLVGVNARTESKLDEIQKELNQIKKENSMWGGERIADQEACSVSNFGFNKSHDTGKSPV